MKRIISLVCLGIITFTVFSQVTKNINVIKAGTLSNLLSSEEKQTITNLNISGEIDASDIKFIRIEITNLSALDLSDVKIIAYNGNGGTISTVTSYPADEMPTYSFYSNYTGAKLSLKSIIFPKKLKSIGSYSFYLCKGLTGNLVLPDSLISIQDYAFYSCTGLSGTLTLPNSVTSTGNSTFYYCIGLTGLSLSNSLIEIGNYTFQFCLNLTGKLILPNTLTSIGYSAFNGCKVYGNLILPNSLTTLKDNAFNGCEWLTSVTIPNSLKIISRSVFQSCKGLTSVTIGSSVNSIGEVAFGSCANLKTIYSLNLTPPELGNMSFVLVAPTSVYVPATSISAYKNAPGWSDYFSSVIMALNTSNQLKTLDAVNVYPNPFKDNLSIKGYEDVYTLDIFDTYGMIVYSQVVSNDESISLSMLKDGIYIARITSINEIIKTKILKESH